ncbi:hypothetical protein AVEN_165610-1, partial [Araneus ventricosus]
IFFIDEIGEHLCNLHGVRFIGKLQKYCLVSNVGVFTDSGNRNTPTLIVDFQNIVDVHLLIGSFYRIAGEVVSGSPITVKAAIVKNVDGIDLQMYKEAVILRRKHL